MLILLTLSLIMEDIYQMMITLCSCDLGTNVLKLKRSQS